VPGKDLSVKGIRRVRGRALLVDVMRQFLAFGKFDIGSMK
jgi:hypothetical protein